MKSLLHVFFCLRLYRKSFCLSIQNGDTFYAKNRGAPSGVPDFSVGLCHDNLPEGLHNSGKRIVAAAAGGLDALLEGDNDLAVAVAAD